MKEDETLDWFVTLFNAGFPDWEREGDSSAKLKTSDVEYSYTTSYFGKCGPRSGSYEVYFARNKKWWNSNNTEARVGLIIHELGHYKHTDGHKPKFYHVVSNCYNRIVERKEKVEDEIGEKIDFEEVAHWLIEDIQQHQVDTRKQTVYEARKEFANDINYDLDEQLAIDGVIVRQEMQQTGFGESSEWIPIEDIKFEPYPMTEISSWLRNPHKDYVRVGKRMSSYKVSEVPVIEAESGYELTDDDSVYAISLLYHTNFNKVCVIFEDEETVQQSSGYKC